MYINNYRVHEFGVLVRFSLPQVSSDRSTDVVGAGRPWPESDY
jgi:hypothetical protein